MSRSTNQLRKNAYSAHIAGAWRRNICAITGCLVVSSSAWAVQVDLAGIDSSSLIVAEGQTLRLNLRASADAYDQIGSQTQCVATGRIVAVPYSEQSPVLGQDFTIEGQEFSIQFTGDTYDTETNARSGAGEVEFGIIALKDKVIDAGEVFRISAENVVVNCTGSDFYGGPITPNVPFMSYGPLVEITDSGVDLEVEKLALLPELESITVLTMSGAQARNKTLSKQIDFARQKSAQPNRVSLKLDGAAIPVVGGSAGDEFSPWGFFVSGDFERGDRELPTTNSFDFTTNTVMAGVDYRLNNHWILGGAISGSQAKADQNGRPDETKLSQSALSIFGSFYADSFYVDALATYGNNNYDMVRSVADGAAGPSDPVVIKSLANADTSGGETSLGLGAGYQFDFKTMQLKLFTRLDYIDVAVDSYSEFSGDDTMLVARINDFSIKSFTSNLGVAYTWIINTDFGVISPELGVDYEHQFKGDGFNVDGQFIGGEAGEFSISTYDKDPNYFNGNLALNAVFTQGVSAYVSYTGQFGRDKWSSNHYALGGRIEF
ncbi:MAG TPA: autotransporter outer membrane beta-barrel domain-containing protein [Cellvibrionaceae bacterium]